MKFVTISLCFALMAFAIIMEKRSERIAEKEIEERRIEDSIYRANHYLLDSAGQFYIRER